MVEMLSSYWAALVTGFAGGSAITVFAAYLLGFRRVHQGSKTLLFPEIDRRPLRARWDALRRHASGFNLKERWFAVTISLMAIVTIAGLTQVTVFSYQQRGCNDEFRRTIAERADVSNDDTRARKENDQAVYELLSDWLKLANEPPAPPGSNREQFIASLSRAVTTYSENTRRQEANEERRAANPYPRC